MNVVNLPLENLLPHRRNMRFVDTLISLSDNGGGVVQADLSADKHYMSGDSVNPVWIVEIMAQAVAAVFVGTNQNKNERPKVGFLIAIEEFRVETEAFPKAGESLLLEVKLIYDLFPVGQYEIEAKCDDRLIAFGRMKFLLAEQEVSA